MKETIKEYLSEVVYALVTENNTSYSQLKKRRFEVGQICTCIDLINNLSDVRDEVVVHTNPNLAFYRKGKQITIEEI